MRQDVNIALVPVETDLDVTTTPGVRRALERLIDSGCRRIILNMAAVGFVDSAGMGLIIREVARMRRLGGILSLTNVKTRVLHALMLARVVDFVPVSVAGTSKSIPELDPSVQPLWRQVIRINPSDLAQTRSRVEILLKRVPLLADERFDANLAVGEAVGNAADHTDCACALVSVASYPDRVIIEVSDCGCGFEYAPLKTAGGAAAGGAAAGGAGTSGAAGGAVAGGAAAGGAGTSGAAGGVADLDAKALEADSGVWDERGRGIKLMCLLVDSVTIEPKSSGVGTVVRLVKLVNHTDQ